jgi:hypothetical protein
MAAVDGNREIRTMVLTMFPCPPLPQMLLKENVREDAVASSHDTIAHGMNLACATYDRKVNEERKTKQRTLQSTYNDALDHVFDLYTQQRHTKDEIKEMVYTEMQKFTRDTITLFMPWICMDKNERADARFMPLDSVSKNSNIHVRAVEHLVAQRQAIGENIVLKEVMLDKEYSDIIFEYFILYSLDDHPERRRVVERKRVTLK